MDRDTMRQWVIKAPFELEMQEAPVPKPREGEALVKVHCVGICGSDVHAYRGHQPFMSYPRILGHEIGVEVVAVVGDNPDGLKAGDRVTLEPVISCGECYPCRHDHPNACVSIQVIGVHTDGGMCEYAAVPTRLLHKTEKLDYEELALVEPLSIGAHAVARAEVKPDDTVFVLGAAMIGLSVMQSARCRGAKVASGDIVPEKLEWARKLGADYVIDMNDPAAAREELMKITHGEGAAVVIEAVGLPQTIESTVDYVAAGGRVVILGVGDKTVTFPQKVFIAKELDIRGSRNSFRNFAEVVRNMEEGRLHMKEFVSHRFGFDQVAEAYAHVHEHRDEVNKALIVFD